MRVEVVAVLVLILRIPELVAQVVLAAAALAAQVLLELREPLTQVEVGVRVVMPALLVPQAALAVLAS
jgi:hypothetical protein